MMSLSKSGVNTSEIEVSHISKHGIWLIVRDREYFLPYDKFPWFLHARIDQILNVQLLQKHHLYWPKLDVDLELNSLTHPEQYPLIYT
jgi:hypothetical protein